MTIKLEHIQAAAQMLRGEVIRTPMMKSRGLSILTGTDVFIKFENMQVTSSFKARGAFVKLASLNEDEKRRGVIAMSAGNHAQAVAYHAARLGIPATIVMPENTPFVKVESTQALGANIVLEGETLVESQAAALAIAKEKDLTLVHPYDDDRIIAGQGTIALEMLEDQPDLDVLIIPIGGGGLFAGNAVAAKAVKPDIKIYGAEAELYASMSQTLRGETVVCGGQTLAEGIAVKNVTERTIGYVRQFAESIIEVSESHLEQAVHAYLTHQKTLAEGAGAAGLAAMLAKPELFKGKKVGLILCGGNIDPRMLASIIYRELAREDRIISLRIQIPDRPGVLGSISSLLGKQGANILEVSHRRMLLDVPAKGAGIDVMLEARDHHHVEAIIQALKDQDYQVRRLDAPGGDTTGKP